MPGPAFYRDLYGPRSDPKKYPMSGDDVIAIKRVLSRAGYLPWTQFTNVYGQNTEDACREFQRDVGIKGPNGSDPSGHYGEKTHDALRNALRYGYPGEYAWDDYSTKLYAEAIVPNEPPSFAFKRILYNASSSKYPMKGDDALAVKRALSRAGFIGWQDFNNVYGEQAIKGCIAFQKSVGIKGNDGGPPQGNYGESTHKKLLKAKAEGKHEWAFDDYSAKLYKGYKEPSAGGSGRDATMNHHSKRVGYTEQPAGSNCDNRSDGIRTSQDHTAGGGTWLRNQPWCGCWCFYGLEAGGVKGLGSWMASVASIEDYAKAKKGCFKGWTTDRSKVKKGDLAVIGGYGVHVETVRGFSGSSTLTYGGNTSPGSSGSQSNGGGAFARTRYPSEVRGYALVRFPGE